MNSLQNYRKEEEKNIRDKVQGLPQISFVIVSTEDVSFVELFVAHVDPSMGLCCQFTQVKDCQETIPGVLEAHWLDCVGSEVYPPYESRVTP